MNDQGRPESEEWHRLIVETHAIVALLQKRQDETVDLLREMNGRVRKVETQIAWMRGVGSALALIMGGGLGWLGWRK